MAPRSAVSSSMAAILTGAAFPTAPAGAKHAGPQLSRRGMGRSGQAAGTGRLYHQGPHHLAARHRLGAVAVQLFPDHSRSGNAAATHRAPCAKYTVGSRIPRQAPRGRAASFILPSRPASSATRADKYLKGRYGGLVGFELAGGGEAGAQISSMRCSCFITSPILAIPAAWRSIRLPQPIPSSRSKSQLATGVSDGYVRLSVGIEHIDDIIADLEQGLAVAGKLASAA